MMKTRNKKGNSHLFNLRIEGIMIIYLICDIYTFQYFLVELWCNGDIISNIGAKNLVFVIL